MINCISLFGEISLEMLGNVETASPVFILCVSAPLIVLTPNNPFINAVHSCDGCSNTTTNLHKDRSEYRIEWFIVHSCEMLAIAKSIIGMLFSCVIRLILNTMSLPSRKARQVIVMRCHFMWVCMYVYSQLAQGNSMLVYVYLQCLHDTILCSCMYIHHACAMFLQQRGQNVPRGGGGGEVCGLSGGRFTQQVCKFGPLGQNMQWSLLHWYRQWRFDHNKTKSQTDL